MTDLTREQIEKSMVEGESPVGLDVYSADGQWVGRVAGFLNAVPEDRRDVESPTVDPVARDDVPDDRPLLLIQGQGTVIQAEIVVPVDQVEVDLRGRQVRLPHLTLAQIEALPNRWENRRSTEPGQEPARPPSGT